MDLSNKVGPIPKDTRYVPIIQQKKCCLPACVSMIMLRHKIPLVAQELLFYKFKMNVSDSSQELFWHNKRHHQLWTNRNGEKLINKALENLRIPLRVKIVKLNQLISPTLYLKEIIRNDKDVIVAFDYSLLYEGEANYNRHVAVIDRIDFKRGRVRLIDPKPEATVWRVVKIKKLLKAMKAYKAYGGFWEFSLNKENLRVALTERLAFIYYTIIT